jgi:regulator of protease activity HflC (stomatin/prohibitin superfamily)
MAMKIWNRGDQSQGQPPTVRSGLLGRAALGIVILVLVFAGLSGSYYTVPEGYRGVILRNGAAIGTALPGLGFKLPFFDQVVDMSVQTEKKPFEGIAAYSRDLQQATMHLSVNYRLDEARVQETFSEVGLSYADKLLTPIVLKRTKEVFGQYTAADVVAQREKVGIAVFDVIQSDMAPHGVLIRASRSRTWTSRTPTRARSEAATAEANVKRARQELEQVRVNAQRQIAEAEAKADATRKTADAEAYAIRARGEAGPRIASRGKALGQPDLVKLIAAERWNGALPTSMIPGGAVPFVGVPQ